METNKQEKEISETNSRGESHCVTERNATLIGNGGKTGEIVEAKSP